MDFQPLIQAFPTLLGTLIGAGVSIATTILSNRHFDKVEARKRVNEYKRRMEEQQIENYEKLQEAVLDYARATVIEYFQIEKQYDSGVTYASLRTDEEKGELLRLSQVRYLILSDRVLNDELRKISERFRDAANRINLYARNTSELNCAFCEFPTVTNELLDAIGVELRKLLASGMLENAANASQHAS